MKKKDFLAIRSGLILNKLGVHRLPLSNRIRPKSPTFHRIDFIVSSGKTIRWCGEDLFLDRKLSLNFHLFGEEYYAFWEYHELKSQINFYRTKDDIIAEVKGLKFRLPFPVGIFELKETLIDECYGFFDVKNAVVLDVGAFIGDSSLYFAWKGAKKVVAYEPVVPSFMLAAENIKLNNYQEKIELVNEAIGDKEGTMQLNYDARSPSLASPVLKTNNSRVLRVKMASIDRVLKSLDHIELLKLDCEGGEWKILPSAIKENSINLVDNIIMEVHVGRFHFDQIEQMKSLLAKANFMVIKQYPLRSDTWLIAATKKRQGH